MTKKDIEESAIDAVKKSVRLTQILDQYISENDKEPSWDGKVYIYNDEKKTKGDLIGRVDVQIKGKVSKTLDDKKIKHDVNIVDLKNYLKDSGVIYFVVLISNNGEYSEIYYNALLPVKIKQILNDTNNTKTIKLKFEKFPVDNRDKINIFMDFYTNSKRQISYVDFKIPSFEDLQKQHDSFEMFQTMNAYGYTDNRKDLLLSFLERETYMYAKIEGNLQPISDVVKLFAIGEDVQQEIKVNNKTYYSSFKRIYQKSGTQIKIGNSVDIVIKEFGTALKIKINHTPMLSNRLKDLDFIINAFEQENLSINNFSLDLSPSNLNLSEFNIDKLKAHYEYCCKIKKLLDILCIAEDINLSSLTEKEERDVGSLITAFVDGKTVRFKETNKSRHIYFKIQNLTILIYAHEEVKNSYEYRYFNIFDGNYIATSSETDKEVKYFYPIYSMLKAENYANISNINFKSILSQYKSLSISNPQIYYQANLDTLQMLLAYDICERKEILDTAIDIMQWLLQDGEKDNKAQNIYQINYFQAIARMRELNESEQETLIAISMSDESQDDIKFAVNVLLKQLPLSKVYLRKLEPSIIEQIKEYPIYNLFLKMDAI